MLPAWIPRIYLAGMAIGLMASLVPWTLLASESVIRGSALYRERIALPPHAVFEARLEDVSRADAPAPVLGRGSIEPAGQVPIPFTIPYATDELRRGHRYNLRGEITVAGELLFITDTAHPVLLGEETGNITLIMLGGASRGLCPSQARVQREIPCYKLQYLS